MKTYTVWGKEFTDSCDAESFLSAMFIDMASDMEIDYGHDAVAWREFFNDWTDGLFKDGLICESAYNDLCPIGDMFE